ncbi:MAG: DUF1778 domain-containing protein [Bacilli bacterium]|jgi:uncharacterized protein (DUF1778 family)
MAIALKEKRIEFRVPNDKKKTIEEAAKLANVSVSSYVINVVYKQAKIDLEQNEIVTLMNSERDSLMEALKNPPKPNEALRALFK